MAYGQPPQYPPQPMPPEGPKQRPTSVTVVVWTQFVTAAVLILTAIAQFSVQGTVEDAVMEELRNDPSFAESGITADDISTFVSVIFVGIAVVYVIFAVFYVVLGLLNNAGKRPARILSWILSGIALLCCGMFGLIGQVAGTTYTVNGESNDQLTQAVEDATPAWATTLEWVSLLLFIFGSLAIIILLAVPASNEFFRKEEPPGGYPGQPPYGQPPYGGPPPSGPGQPPTGPGQPPASGQPPYPGQ